MIKTTYLTVGEIHTKTYQELVCSPSFAGGLQNCENCELRETDDRQVNFRAK